MLSLMARQAPQSEADVKAAVALSLPAMQLRFPAETYCQASLDAVAATERFWNEAGVTRALETWQSANSPQSTTALPVEAETAPVSPEAKQWLAHWYRATEDEQCARALDLIRSRSEEAFAYLVRVDMRAADIAVWRKWAPPARETLMADWDDEAGIRRRVRKLVALPRGPSRLQAGLWNIAFNALVQAVKVNAPQHADALLDELRWIASGGLAAEVGPIPVAFQAPPMVEFDDEMFR
jgi:hypothetical protein